MRLQRQRKMARAPAKLESALLLTEEWNTSSNDLLNFFVLIVQKLPNIERSRWWWGISRSISNRRHSGARRLIQPFQIGFLGSQMVWALIATHRRKCFQFILFTYLLRLIGSSGRCRRAARSSLPRPPIFQNRCTSENRLLERSRRSTWHVALTITWYLFNFLMKCQSQSLESLVLSECLALLGRGSGEDSISNIGCNDCMSGESKTLTENIGLPTGVRGAADEAALSASIAACKLSTAASHCIGQARESCSSGKFANTEPRSLLFNLSPLWRSLELRQLTSSS